MAFLWVLFTAAGGHARMEGIEIVWLIPALRARFRCHQAPPRMEGFQTGSSCFRLGMEKLVRGCGGNGHSGLRWQLFYYFFLKAGLSFFGSGLAIVPVSVWRGRRPIPLADRETVP